MRNPENINILIGFEESQEICIQFRELGFNAYSCDTQISSGGHPEWHLKIDIFEAIKLKEWDLIILHPPCTYTALCGNRWYHDSPLRKEGIKLCQDSWEAALKVCERVVLEQPKTIMQNYIGIKSQVIHPYMFGHKEYKETWLWIRGLPGLVETNNVLRWMLADDRKNYEKVFRMPPGKDRSKLRSKTYRGIAMAMATQWSYYLYK
jgi:hypothetical protein